MLSIFFLLLNGLLNGSIYGPEPEPRVNPQTAAATRLAYRRTCAQYSQSLSKRRFSIADIGGSRLHRLRPVGCRMVATRLNDAAIAAGLSVSRIGRSRIRLA